MVVIGRSFGISLGWTSSSELMSTFSSIVFYGEEPSTYHNVDSSNTISPLTRTFQVEGLKTCTPFAQVDTLRFSDFGSSFCRFSSRMCTNAMDPNIFGYTVLLQCMSTCKFSLNSFLPEINFEIIGKVLFSSVCAKAPNMSSYFFFGSTFKYLGMWEHITLLSHGEAPSVSREVIYEGDIILTSFECCHLS